MKIEKDLREFSCPVPVVETKKIIKANEPGTEVKLLISNINSRDNVCRMLKDLGKEITVNEVDDYYEISFGV